MAALPSGVPAVTDPLLKAQLEAIQAQIEQERQQNVATAQGNAVSRGLTGSTYQGVQESLANKFAGQQSTDAAVNLAIQNAAQVRQDRQIKEQQTFEAGQADLNRQWQSLEAQKQQAFQNGQTDLARQFEAQQNELARSAESKNANTNLIGQGIGAGANLLGGLLAKGSLFGGRGVPETGFQMMKNPITGVMEKVPIASMGVKAGPFGLAAGGGILSTGAGLLGGGYAGQSLAKLTGRNTREAKFGSAAGAGIGTLFGGPIGGVLGGAAGGLATKGIQGVAKGVKKLFCFAPNTPIIMEDGSEKRIADIQIGDETAGGRVFSVRRAETDDMIYQYRGIRVSGHHAVHENGVWKRVKDSIFSIPIMKGGFVVSIATENHRIYIPTEGFIYTKFADELETDNYENLTIDESLDVLNQEPING